MNNLVSLVAKKLGHYEIPWPPIQREESFLERYECSSILKVQSAVAQLQQLK